MRTLARSALIGACILMITGAATAAMAQRGGWRDPDVRMSRLERMAEYLELSDQQIDQLNKLREEGRAEMADLRKEMLRIHNEIQGEMLEDSPDAAKLKDLLAKKGEIHTQMDMARLEHRLAMREILTEEQRDRMMMRRGFGRRCGFHDGGRGFGRGGMGHERGHRGAGLGFGMGLDDPEHDCLGHGPGPYLWCEK